MLISLVLVIPSCGGRRTAQVEPPVPTENKEQLIKNQQLVVQDETEDIDDLIDNPNDDDKGASLCPKCHSKVDL